MVKEVVKVQKPTLTSNPKIFSMKIITSEVELCKYLPNMFATVKGEVSLFDKDKVDIDLAENWVIETLVSTKTFNTICGYADSNNIKILCSRLVVADASPDCGLPQRRVVQFTEARRHSELYTAQRARLCGVA